jgi:hypothetical protein
VRSGRRSARGRGVGEERRSGRINGSGRREEQLERSSGKGGVKEWEEEWEE